MRVFVAGATGVLGRALLPRLKAAGHDTIGLARSPASLVLVDKLGAAAVRGDLLDSASLESALAAQTVDAAINLAGAIPLRLKINVKDWETNDRIRREGTRNLLRAVRNTQQSACLVVQQSVGYVCASRGSEWITEESPRSTDPFLKATCEMEDQVRASELPSVLLRFGALMAVESWHTQQSVVALRRGMLPIVGDGAAYLSLIHVDDAVSAILNVLERPGDAAGKTINVTADAPAPMSEVFPFAASCLKAPPPRHVAAFLAKMLVGNLTLDVLLASYRMSNTRLKQEFGFAPKFPTYREIWSDIAAQIGARDYAPSGDLK